MFKTPKRLIQKHKTHVFGIAFAVTATYAILKHAEAEVLKDELETAYFAINVYQDMKG